LRAALTVYSPGERHARHAHVEANVSLILAGSLEERVAGTTAAAGPLSLVVKPAHTEHADRFGPAGARLLRVQVPDGWGGRLDDGTAPLARWGWRHDGRDVARFLRVYARVRRVRQVDLGADGGAGSAPHDEAETALADLLAGIGADLPAGRGTPPRWLARVREALDDAPATAGVRTRELAGEAGVHPVYFARQFRRFYGCSLSTYVRRRRAATAAEWLAGSTVPLSDVALRAGFADQSHACRGVAAATGLTPRAFRTLARTDAGGDENRVPDTGGRTG
jgi:AraC family transcriptional regulator